VGNEGSALEDVGVRLEGEGIGVAGLESIWSALEAGRLNSDVVLESGNDDGDGECRSERCLEDGEVHAVKKLMARKVSRMLR
jgi:hypothetical protein